MNCTRFATLLLALALAVTSACGAEDVGGPQADEEFVQPGIDDPTARQWERGGSWYPDDHIALRERIESLYADVELADEEPRPARGVLTPHASLGASGHIAAEVYARVEVPDLVILLAPKHHGDGEPVATWKEGPWLVPGAALDIRHDLVDELLDGLGEDGLVADRAAFTGRRSHPPEMQLPFLGYENPDTELVPLSFHDHADMEYRNFPVERMETYGKAVADLVREREEAGETVLIVATTDLVHYQTVEVSDERDAKMMEYVTALDVQGLYDYVVANEVSICGEIPTTIFMIALRELGFESAELVARGNSYHLTKNEDNVVGYPGVIAWR